MLRQYAGDKWFASHNPTRSRGPAPQNPSRPSCVSPTAIAIPVTARGAGYGYVGGCVPLRGGIVLSLERMNRILEINAGDFVVVTQPGRHHGHASGNAVEKQKLFYPPDPASRGESFIGGNIVTNAGGPRCLKYGVTRDYVLGLEVVLAMEQSSASAAAPTKTKPAFDLHRLFVGSEGLLGVVTEATLKLLPLPPYRANLAIGFPNDARGDSFAARDSWRRLFYPPRWNSRILHPGRRVQTDPERDACAAAAPI